MNALAAGLVPVQDERLLYPAMDLVTSTPLKTDSPIVPGSGRCLFPLGLASPRDSMNSL